VIKDKSR